jgi:threonine/homoserine/homoserine lactone efflux protein
MSLTYLAAAAVEMLTPGPDMLFCHATGLSGGPRAGLKAALGTASGEVVHITAAAIGLGALVRAEPTAFHAVRAAGAAYLMLLAVRTFRRHRPSAAPRGSAGDAYVRGLVTNLLNPKMAVFALALLPTFIDPRAGSVALQFAVLGATFIAMEIAVDGTVGILAGRLQRRLEDPRTQRRLSFAAGAVYLGLAAGLWL